MSTVVISSTTDANGNPTLATTLDGNPVDPATITGQFSIASGSTTLTLTTTATGSTKTVGIVIGAGVGTVTAVKKNTNDSQTFVALSTLNGMNVRVLGVHGNAMSMIQLT